MKHVVSNCTAKALGSMQLQGVVNPHGDKEAVLFTESGAMRCLVSVSATVLGLVSTEPRQAFY